MAPAGFSLEPLQLGRLHTHPYKQSMWFSAALLPLSTHTKPRPVVIISYSTAWCGVPCMETWILVLLLPGWRQALPLGWHANLRCRVLQQEIFLSRNSSIWQKMLKQVLCFRKSESDCVPWWLGFPAECFKLNLHSSQYDDSEDTVLKGAAVVPVTQNYTLWLDRELPVLLTPYCKFKLMFLAMCS